MDNAMTYIDYINETIRIISPIVMLGTTIGWITIFLKMKKQIEEMFVRTYELEKEIILLKLHADCREIQNELHD
jgi:hypothetical protein